MKFARNLFAYAAAALLLPSVASAQVFARDLPSMNLNNAAGANRSNVTWAFGSGYMVGDDFSFGASDVSVNSLTVWTSFGPVGSATPFSDRYTNLQLYLGTTTTGLSAATATATIAQVSYPDIGTSQYQLPNDGFVQMYSITFTGINFQLGGGQTGLFGVYADAVDPNDYFFLSASNAALSGGTQDGADGRMYYANTANLADNGYWCSGNGNTPVPANTEGPCEGWDKTSDINVRVTGTTVPEPSTYVLLATGLFGIAAIRRRSAR